MAVGEDSTEAEEKKKPKDKSRGPSQITSAAEAAEPSNHESEEDSEEEEEDDDEEEEEPHLKYATLTKSLSALYRNGDASSAFLVAGDKMIVGTQVGNIHVLSLPSFTSLKAYRAHSAGVSSISISPPTPSLSLPRPDATQKLAAESTQERDRSPTGSPAGKSSRPGPVPNTQSNQIHIASSSIDGKVCIASLVDLNDVQQRDFGRPVQTVALSPEYRSDRSYLSGGRAGNLILTVGGQAGRSATASTSGTAAAASGWLASIGLGSNTGTDKILHSGEGAISTIKWSLSGKYVLWVNEHGIKIMRSHLKLSSSEANLEWKRMGHVDPPRNGNWEDMASVWRAQAEWINPDSLESDDLFNPAADKNPPTNGTSTESESKPSSKRKIEEVVVGWGDAVWILKVYPSKETASNTVSDEHRLGKVEVATIIRIDDCTISGISLYTPNVLLVLAYMEKKGNQKSKEDSATISGSRRKRHTAIEPELRLIDITTKEEIDADTLSVSRFETLSAVDYHLGILPAVRVPANLAQKGYLGALGSGVSAIGSGIGTVSSGIYTGVETVGQGMWDATMYGPRKLGANRLFSGGDSIRSGQVANDRSAAVRERNYLTGWIPGFGSSIFQQNEELASVATTMGMKIFIFSPYDCIIAVKRTLADRLQWLISNEKYQQAWELADEHPEAAGVGSDSSDISPPNSPSRTSSVNQGTSTLRSQTELKQHATLAEFFADSISITSSAKGREKKKTPKADREKRRIGELWLKQLVEAKKWTQAGEVAAKVLDLAPRWEYWIWQFVRNNKFDEISPHVPTLELTPPLPSSIFEIILGHYVAEDRKRFKELLDQWPSDLFEISSISSAILEQLKSGDVTKGSSDWTNLQECLAKLYLADGHYDEALRCYIHLQDADTAMSLIKEHHLISAIADDISSFVLLSISAQQIKSASPTELDQLSSAPIRLLVDEAAHGTVDPQDVVDQLTDSSLRMFLYFYLRSLWRGHGTKEISDVPKVGRQNYSANLVADSGKVLVEEFADTAVELFAEYDRPLLSEFLHSSTAYTFEKAVKICEQKHDVEELVYLLSKTGQMKKALFLIINELDDVSKAITFAKEQNDTGLWDDLLEYSMSRPRFISGLLSEVGMAIDPITLVKRIPSGLEIQGLKSGLKKMIREYDLQDSLSTGVANVLMSEVAVGMDALRRGRRKGIKFDVVPPGKKSTKPQASEQKDPETKPVTFLAGEEDVEADEKDSKVPDTAPGYCVGCGRAFHVDDTDTLVGFACGHAYHLKHLLRDPSKSDGVHPPVSDEIGDTRKNTIPGVSLPDLAQGDGVDDPEDVLDSTFDRSVGPKVTNARLLKDRIDAVGGCRACKVQREKLDQV